MRLVRQRTEVGCGIAVAAMVAGCSWSKSSEADNGTCSRIGLSVSQFEGLCDKLGSPIKVIRASIAVPLNKATRPQGTCAALIRKSGKPRGHFVALTESDVLDPDLGRSTIAKYQRRNWLVLRWFTRA